MIQILDISPVYRSMVFEDELCTSYPHISNNKYVFTSIPPNDVLYLHYIRMTVRSIHIFTRNTHMYLKPRCCLLLYPFEILNTSIILLLIANSSLELFHQSGTASCGRPASPHGGSPSDDRRGNGQWTLAYGSKLRPRKEELFHNRKGPRPGLKIKNEILGIVAEYKRQLYFW